MSFFLFQVILFLLGIVFVVYFIYFVIVLNTDRKIVYLHEITRILSTATDSKNLPGVSVTFPAYNEAPTIYAKLKSISEFDYPREKIEVFVVNDCSTDNTREIAKKAFEDFGLRGKIIDNRNRMGANASYSTGISEANFEYVLTTDVDSEIPKDALKMAVTLLMHLKDIGGVAAKMIPVSNENTMAAKIEGAYANMYGSMLIAESSIFSTFPGSTCCTLIRKSSFSPIQNLYGSSDGNISLSIIKNGLRFIYVPNIVYYEPVSNEISEQRRQKIRRATRLIQSTLLNRDILFKKEYKEFGEIIFPLRFAMLVICPIFIVSAVILALALAYSLSFTLLVLLSTFLGVFIFLGLKTKISLFNLLTSFFIHQIYLSLGLLLSHKKMNVWEPIERRHG